MAEPGIRRRRQLSARAAGKSGRGPGARRAGRISPAAWDLSGSRRWRRRLALLLREREHPLSCLPGILRRFGRPHASFPGRRCSQTPRPRRDGSGSIRGVWGRGQGPSSGGRWGSESLESEPWCCPSSLCDLGQVSSPLWPQLTCLPKGVLRLAARSS